METSYISTRALNEGNRLSILKLQQQVAIAAKESTTGRLADVGRTLGARTAETVSLRQEMSQLASISDTNALVASRLAVSQEALGGINSTAESFISTLIASRNTETGPAVAKAGARAALVGLTDALNSTFGGEQLFGGINTDQQTLNSYFAQPTSAARQAMLNAFQTEFGFAPDDPAVATIVPSQMQSFIDNQLTALFEEPAWSANWSNASDENVESRISMSEEIETSANANDAGFRKLAQVYTMLSDMGVENMSASTYSVVVDRAIALAGDAGQDVAVAQATLGTAQERVTKANAKIEAQSDILT